MRKSTPDSEAGFACGIPAQRRQVIPNEDAEGGRARRLFDRIHEIIVERPLARGRSVIAGGVVSVSFRKRVNQPL
jgi:hypothetical protein